MADRKPFCIPTALQLWALLAPSAVKLPTMLWDVIYNEGPTNLCLASAFAQYIAARGAIAADDAEEAFDYLRDAFLFAAVVQSAQAGGDEDITQYEETGLGLLAWAHLSTQLCVSLTMHGSLPLARFSLESPLTETFVAELRRLTDDAAPSPNPANRILAQRIEVSGIAAATLGEMRRVAREIAIDEGAFAFTAPIGTALSDQVVLPERNIVFFATS
ncbi:hypothetical protein AURDEDRAFT_189089 [Auricularia subglabra TFB-10046 SS5]|uniref:Uncharacterized protein n=1 Tax=Auricularia subglabra (strain TFB-10046 / SS5) TaxID=717982 RepID=J0WLN0_AURST|nr:hypothetical protein AURDEDRAFT_189089 [Auricularia subglabra TFB-10046 SS5]